MVNDTNEHTRKTTVKRGQKQLLQSRGPDGGAIPERNLARGGSPSKRDADREKRYEAKLQRQARQHSYKLIPIEEKPAA
jgi:hypothetical protein